MGEQETESATDIIIFFDANMPKMDVCRDGCSDNPSVFCRHRFNFNCYLTDVGNLHGLSDFKVVRRFLNLIDKIIPLYKEKKSRCILVTKDHNFISDVKMDYFDELQGGVDDIKLDFSNNLITRCVPEPVAEIIVLLVKHEPYGCLKKDDLRDAIQKLNQFQSDGLAL